MFKKLGQNTPPGSQPIPTSTLAREVGDRSITGTVSLTTYNLGASESVAAPTPIPLPSRLETTATSRSVAKDTAVNALKLLLKIASDIPGLGVKPALSGLLTIIERVQVCWRCIG